MIYCRGGKSGFRGKVKEKNTPGISNEFLGYFCEDIYKDKPSYYLGLSYSLRG